MHSLLEVNFGNQPENDSPPKTATVVGRRQCLRDDGCRVSSQSEPETLLDRKTQVVGHSLVASTPGLSTRSGNLFARNQSQGETVMQVAMDGLVQSSTGRVAGRFNQPRWRDDPACALSASARPYPGRHRACDRGARLRIGATNHQQRQSPCSSQRFHTHRTAQPTKPIL